MKKHMAVLVLLGVTATLSAASRISDEAYRLVRGLVTYKNLEIEALHRLNEYTMDCHNVSDDQFAAKKCSNRLAALQDLDRSVQVKHDVLGQEIATHIRQHKDEEWLFIGLMLDDKDFSNFAH